MKKTLIEIASFLNGKVSGDPQVVIENIRGIDEAGVGDLTFIANPKYRNMFETTNASAVLVSPETEKTDKNLIIVEDPYIALGKVLELFHPEERDLPTVSKETFIEEGAIISEDATIHPNVYIGRGARIERGVILHPGVCIGRHVVIGEDSILYPNVVVYRRCIIGKRVILHAGVVIGSDGFGFARPGQANIKIPQVGIVQIDDDVEVGANTTVDRGTIDKTWIQKNVKIDNLVQIAHNVVIGENSVIVSQVGISGSTKLGKSVILGGQAGLVGHLTIGDYVMVGAQSGVHEDVPSNQIVSGSPHMPHRQWLRVEACVSHLPEMRKTVATLLKRVEELEKNLKTLNTKS
ncbi:MAG TPA: UDP-3-O-(3-hydroxymyristoyl)glucosamine N-acyltransferase [Syntrophales bacterium]|nr:UDP-3-O-(3-hydroxymyristoyl)glucosamine N-acyltransferase [Syntrophales bacterium]